MELFKSENSPYGSNINKFSLKCEDDKDKWLNLITLLYKSIDNNAVIIKGVYDKKKDIVLKIGFQEAINKEYYIAEILKTLPCFITYYCKFMCNDDIFNIIINQNILINYKICNNGNKPIRILIMNYYPFGSIGNYKWNIENFTILKNVLKQTIFGILYAYEKKGFIHGDLHIHNILLKPKKNNFVTFGKHKIEIDTFEIRIMDFEKSKLNVKNDFMSVIKNIQKLLNSICDSNNLEINIGYEQLKLRKLLKDNFNDSHYDMLNDIVNTLTID